MNWKCVAVRLDDALGSPSHSDRLTSVEGVRGVAMSLVFLIHLLEFYCRRAPAGSIDSEAIWLIYPIGNLAGIFFVVITGCFLYRSLLSKPVNYFTFLKRRLTRLYSVFSVVLLAYLGLSFIFPSESKLPHQPAAAFLYVVQNLLLLPGVFPVQAIISVSWTLSYIVLACLILPPLVEFTGMRRWRPRSRVVFFVSLMVVTVMVADLTGWYANRIARIPMGAVVWEALAWRSANRDKAPWLERAALATGVVALVLKYCFVVWDGVSIFDCSRGLHQFAASTVCMFCISYATFSANAKCSKFLTAKPLRWLGNISYSYYLTHGLFINFLTMFAPAMTVVLSSVLGFWTAVMVAYALSILPAAALYFLVEKPSLAWAARADRPKVGDVALANAA